MESSAGGVERSDHGLKKDAIGFLDGLIIGIASTAPAYSLAAVLAIVVSAFLYMNRADPVGGWGESPIRGAILGSTPHKLLHLSDTPVVVVPG